NLSQVGFHSARHWPDYGTIINAAAYTRVDSAETADGRAAAWATNVCGVAALARIATAHQITLVQISSDYVFDGTHTRPYSEIDPVSPLGVYGQTKAAADQIVETVPRHYIVRTSWVIGDGNNFVRTMISLAERGVYPSVVNDQRGRLTFTSELSRGIRHLIDNGAEFGTYNLTSDGNIYTWAEVARRVFELVGKKPDRVTAVSTQQYYQSHSGVFAPRPSNSALDLSKIASTGFVPAQAEELLRDYVDKYL
ncbi:MULTISPECIES: NAD(P)-dependent oxidoreductase, partial [unclassified Mycobacterium]